MAKISIPFIGRFKEPLLAGVKTCTARTKKFGLPGDTFEAFGQGFRLVDVSRKSLFYICSTLWKEEGCAGSADFIEVWNSIHPKKGYDPEQVVWLHKFEKVR